MFKYALKNISTGEYVTCQTKNDYVGSLYQVLGYDSADPVYLESESVLFNMILQGTAVGSYYLEIDSITPDYKDLRIIPIPFP